MVYRLPWWSNALFDLSFPPDRVWNWATRGSAAALGREDIGLLGPGKEADLDTEALIARHQALATRLVG